MTILNKEKVYIKTPEGGEFGEIMGAFQRIQDETETIQAIDNHSHMNRPYPGGFEAYVKSMVEYLRDHPSTRLQYGGGALLPLRDEEHAEVLEVLQELYSFEHNSITEKNADELISKIIASRKSNVAKTYNNVLDTAGIEIALIDTQIFNPELDPRRFRWVPRIDPLLYPLRTANNQIRALAGESFERFEGDLDRIYKNHGGTPETWEEYLGLVEQEVKHYKSKGALAVKIWSAFFRSLYFQHESETEAKKIFTKYLTRKIVNTSEYTRLQDFIAHHILALCQELKLAVHVHTGFGLANQMITLQDSSPLNLENIARDPQLKDLKLVLIHGGYPFYREAGSLARMRDNIFLDFSWLSVLIPPIELARILREWIVWKLEDRILFGTDAEHTPWAIDDVVCVYGTRRAKDALNFTLADLVEDRVLNDYEAINAAWKILRENAMSLYKL